MTRTDFEILRDIPGKVIRQDIRLSRRERLKPALEADGILIQNSVGVDLRMNIRFNPERGAKTINVYVPGTGAICRLDVDGPAHGDAGRSHKHALQSERCPDRNLPDNVAPRPDLSGQSIEEVFREFCKIGTIEFDGAFTPPEDGM